MLTEYYLGRISCKLIIRSLKQLQIILISLLSYYLYVLIVYEYIII